MGFPDPENRVVVTAPWNSPAHLTGAHQVDGDLAGNTTDGLTPSDDCGDTVLVDAILQ